MTTSTGPYLTRRQVAQLGNCTVETITNWTKNGILPEPVRVGGRLLYPRAAVLAALHLDDDTTPEGGAA